MRSGRTKGFCSWKIAMISGRFFTITWFPALFGWPPVPSGVESLREIIKDPFDLIVCDMMMPRVGGEMFYWAVSRVRPAAGQRFIFFTGHKNNPRINSFFQRVNATVLFKLEALDSAIRDVVRKLA
jgi:CheY-like chemotaxis protein